MKFLSFSGGFALSTFTALSMVFLGPGKIFQYFDLISLFIVIGIPAGMMAALYGSKAFFIHKLHRNRRREIITQWDKLCMNSACLAVLVAIVQVGFHLSNPDMLGPAMAVAALPAIYAYAFRIFLFTPLKPGLRIPSRH